jgi:phospholipase/lecithinase/hemolysin
MRTGKLHLLAAAFSAALLLAGCGGGGDAAPPKANIQRAVIAGDSLADVGAFGFKFTVQNSASPATGFPIFPELVAQNFGIASQCNFFVFTGTTFVTNTTAGCTNFAIGASRIVNPASQGGAAGPQSIPLQLATAAQAVGGAYAATDLVLVDGGGNDSGDLLTAFLGAGAGNVAGYQTFLAQQLDSGTIATTLPQPNGAATLAVLYMRKLAATYYTAVKVNALDRGATHVAVLDMPDISLTPRIQAVLAQVSAANGGGTAGATAAANVQAVLRQWTDAFNSELRAQVGSDARVAIVPFNLDFTEEVTHPVDFALTNVSAPACGVVGVTAFGDPRPCTSAALDAAPPTGLSAGWWQTWAFSDGFHPTPFGHRLLAASVNRALARAGWL